jgi:hypothetical protein
MAEWLWPGLETVSFQSGFTLSRNNRGYRVKILEDLKVNKLKHQFGSSGNDYQVFIWDCETQTQVYSFTVNQGANDAWQESSLPETITLLANKEYAFSINISSSYRRTAKSNVSSGQFDPRVQFLSSAIGPASSFPADYTDSYVYAPMSFGYETPEAPPTEEKELYQGASEKYETDGVVFNSNNSVIKSQNIIRSDWMAAAGISPNVNIWGIKLYIGDLPLTDLKNFRIGLAHTTKTSHSRSDGFIPDADYSMLHHSEIIPVADLTANSEIEFMFDAPFQWDGAQNLSLYLAREVDSPADGGSMLLSRPVNFTNFYVYGVSDDPALTYPYSSLLVSGNEYYHPKLKMLIEAKPITYTNITPDAIYNYSSFYAWADTYQEAKKTELNLDPINHSSTFEAIIGTYQAKINLNLDPINSTSSFKAKVTPDNYEGVDLSLDPISSSSSMAASAWPVVYSSPEEIQGTGEMAASAQPARYAYPDAAESKAEVTATIGIYQAEDFIILRDYETNVFVTKLYNVFDPLVYEEINDKFELTFTSVADGNLKYLMNSSNMIEIENNYFRMARYKPKRSLSGTTIDVVAEHVSYELNTDKPFENIEAAPRSIMQSLIGGTRFTIGNVEFFNPFYFEPKADTIRGCLIEMADYLGGELVWNKFSISLIQKRGQQNGIEFKLGENIVGVTADVDLTGGQGPAYEVDVLDLAHLPEYQSLAQVQLGDEVSLEDPDLLIKEKLRVVSHERNPFNKVVPKIQIGNVIRDFIEYVREEVEEKEEDPEGNNSDIYMFEFGKGDLVPMEMRFKFKSEYDDVLSVTTGLIGGESTTGTTLVTDPYKNSETGKFAGVKLMAYGDIPEGAQVSIQAVCFTAATETAAIIAEEQG